VEYLCWLKLMEQMKEINKNFTEKFKVNAENFFTKILNANKSLEHNAVFNEDYRKLMADLSDFEERLKLSDDRFQKTIEKTPIGVCITNEWAEYEYVNPAYCNIYGYSSDELIGKSFTTVVPESMKTYFLDLHTKFLNDGVEIRNEWDVIGKNGETIHILADAARIIGTDGKPRKATFVLDISEQRHSKLALLESEERFRIIFEKNPLGIALTDIYTGKFIRANKAFTETFGYNHHELLALTADDITHPDDVHLNIEIRKLYQLSPDKEISVEKRNLTKSGKTVWVNLKLLRIDDNDGNPLYSLAMMEDITGKKLYDILQADINFALQLLAHGESIESVLSSLTQAVKRQDANLMCAIYVIDESRTNLLSFVSPQLKERKKAKICVTSISSNEGITAQAVKQKKLIINTNSDADKELSLFFNDVEDLEIKSSYSIPIMNSLSEILGAVTFYSKQSDKPSDKNLNIIHTIADIAGLAITKKTAEESLLKAKNEAENANLAKSLFLANMSHEIRTPMNAIIGFSNMLKSSNINNDKYHEYVDGIIVSGNNLINLINDILDLSKIESGSININYEFFDLRDILQEIKTIFQLKIEQKQLGFDLKICQHLPANVYLDPVRVRQILFNLVGNAVKFTAEGSVYIEINCLSFDKANKSFTLQIKVVDTGIGIKSEHIDIIFQPFQQIENTISRHYEGTGLGLAITKRLLEKMNGHIKVESQANNGSQFIIELPDVTYSDAKNNLLTKAPIQNETIRFNHQQILLAEDIRSNREVVKAYLSDTNLSILEAENGIEVLKVLKHFKPDLILMDMMMPEMDGYQAIRKIKENPELSDIPIIAITASALTQNEIEISQICNGYLRKPISKLQLINELKKYLYHSVESVKIVQNTFGEKISYIMPAVINVVPDEMAQYNELLPQWEEIQKSLVIGKIDEFNSAIYFIAQEYQNHAVLEYTRTLKRELNNFNIEAIEKLISFFPEFISKMSISED